jgi:tetratricopeptide (TPR) repeat protein
MGLRSGGERRSRGKRRSTKTKRISTTWILRLALGLIAALIVFAGTVQIQRRVNVQRLPPLPDLSSQPKAVSEHLLARFDAARADPRSDQAVGALCVAYHADMFHDQADRCYALASALNPDEWRWKYYQALIHSERGEADVVAAAMREVTGKIDFGPAWWRLGEAEFKEGRYDLAEEAWRRALKAPEPERAGSAPPSRSFGEPRRSSPEDRASGGGPPHPAGIPLSAHASLGLARLALARGNADDARQILERVTTTSPRFSSGFRLLAESYTLLSRQADADTALRRANRLPPYAPYADPMVDALARESRNGTFLLRQASEADLADSAEWSEYLTRRALEFDPDNPDVVAKLGRILRTLGRTGEALEVFQRYQQMVPGDKLALAQIGGCLTDLGKFGEAESYLRRALGGLEDGLTHYNLGLLLAQTNRLDEAVAEYKLALTFDPNDARTHNNLAAVLARQGKLDQAARELTRALEIDPDNANTHTNLGLVYTQQGHRERAAREFETALRINPDHPAARDALRALR